MLKKGFQNILLFFYVNFTCAVVRKQEASWTAADEQNTNLSKSNFWGLAPSKSDKLLLLSV